MGNNNVFFFLVVVLINILFFKCVRSAVYSVGDDERWISDLNYDAWSQKYNFSIGDVLVFKYVKGQHNVYEVEEATYRSCDASSGIIAKYESGNDEVKLTQEKKYWFICNINGHCLGGMRFNIDVKAIPPTSNSPMEQPSPPSAPSPNSSACCKSLERCWTFFIYMLIAFETLIILYHM